MQNVNTSAKLTSGASYLGVALVVSGVPALNTDVLHCVCAQQRRLDEIKHSMRQIIFGAVNIVYSFDYGIRPKDYLSINLETFSSHPPKKIWRLWRQISQVALVDNQSERAASSTVGSDDETVTCKTGDILNVVRQVGSHTRAVPAFAAPPTRPQCRTKPLATSLDTEHEPPMSSLQYRCGATSRTSERAVFAQLQVSVSPFLFPFPLSFTLNCPAFSTLPAR
ncbi:hypothetical protein B0H19DRAFT_1243229, partial [Mycena capillaripes]